MGAEDLEKRVCEWLLFVYNEAKRGEVNPWRLWSRLGKYGLKRRDVDYFLLKNGYNPFEREAYIRFVKENLEFIERKARDC